MGVHFPNSKAKKSYGAVAVFSIIALMGALLTLSSYPGKEKASLVVAQSTAKPFVNAYPRNVGIKYVTKTVLITGLFILFLLLAMKWYKKRWRDKNDNPVNFVILGRRYLSSKHYLLLVRVKNYELVLGVTDQNITLLNKYESEDEENSDRLKAEQDRSFTNALKGLLTKESV